MDGVIPLSPGGTPRSMSPLVGGLIHDTLESVLLAVDGDEAHQGQISHLNAGGNWVLDVPFASQDAAVSSWIGVLGERDEDGDEGAPAHKLSEATLGGNGAALEERSATSLTAPILAEAHLAQRRKHDGIRDDEQEDEVVRMLQEKISSCNAQLHAFFHTL